MSTRIRIDAARLPGELRREAQEVGADLRRGLGLAAHRSKAEISKRTPVDLGQLRASWRVRPGHGELAAELVNDAPHAGIVELGARPHPVSREGQEAIYEWARRHFGLRGARGKVRRIQGGAFEDPMLRRITMGIVMKIRRKGQRPTYFVRRRLRLFRRFVADEAQAAIRRAQNRGGG